MINNINNSNNYNSITVQQEVTTNGEEEKVIKNRNNELYKKIIDYLCNISKECYERVWLKHKKISVLLEIYNRISPERKEYNRNVLNLETLKKEFELLQKIWTIITEMNKITFSENIETYELNRKLKCLDDKYDEHTKNEFIKFKELCIELINLFDFYKENKINDFGYIKKMYDKFARVDNYFNIFTNCLKKLVGCRISEDFSWFNRIVNDEKNKNDKNDEENKNDKNDEENKNDKNDEENKKDKNDENKEIEIYETRKIKKKDRKKATYLHLYMDLKMRRNVFRKLLDYVKDSNYLEEVVKKEEKILKRLFGYLENLVRNLNIPNCMVEGNGLCALDFDLNHEFDNLYNAESKDSDPVKFKYMVCDVIDNFYRKEIRNIENKIGKKNEEMNVEKYGKDEKEEEKLKEIYENLAKENEAYYDFIFHLVFDAINEKMLNSDIFNNYCKVNYKYEMQKFYNLQNMLRIVYKFIKNFTEESIEKSRVKYYKDIIYCLKNERAMLRKIYDFIMSYVPELKDKEKFINKFINVDFEKLSEKEKEEIEKEKEEIEKEKEEIKNSFKKAFLDEIEKIKDPIVIRDDLWQLNNKGFPVLGITDIFDEEFNEDSRKSSIKLNGYFFGDLKYSSVFLPKISKIRDINFNSVFNEIESVVDEYGYLKQNNTINDEEPESNEEILRKLEKCYTYFSNEGSINVRDFRLLKKLVEEYRDLVNNSKNQPESNNKNSILNKLYKILNETINFYLDEKNGKFFIYDIFYRIKSKKS